MTVSRVHVRSNYYYYVVTTIIIHTELLVAKIKSYIPRAL